MLGLSLKQVVAEDKDSYLLDMVEQLEEMIRQQEKHLKNSIETLENLKSKLEKREEENDKDQSLVQKEKNAMENQETSVRSFREMIDQLRLGKFVETPEEKQLETIYDDGFFLKGRDDTLKIGGWYQADARFYLDEEHPKANTFTNRRARLDVRGTLENYWGYRLYASFVGSPVIQEAWLEYRYFPFARLKFGQFKEPFSLESQYSARWIDFIERSMGVTALQPAEDIGLMLFGKFWNDQITYGVGYFNGQGRGQNAVVDDKDVTGRVVFQPLRQQKDSILQQLYIGGSFGFGNNERNIGNRSFQTAGQTPFFNFVKNAQFDGDFTRYGFELEWLNGPLNFTTEFIGTNFEKISASSVENELEVNGWYITLSYLLTGENAARNRPVKPFSNFDIKNGGWGAWQFLARYDLFWTDDRNFIQKGIASGTNKVDAFMIGINWWPNLHLRFMLNFAHTSFDDVIIVSNKKIDEENVLLMRGQFNF